MTNFHPVFVCSQLFGEIFYILHKNSITEKSIVFEECNFTIFFGHHIRLRGLKIGSLTMNISPPSSQTGSEVVEVMEFSDFSSCIFMKKMIQMTKETKRHSPTIKIKIPMRSTMLK